MPYFPGPAAALSEEDLRRLHGVRAGPPRRVPSTRLSAEAVRQTKGAATSNPRKPMKITLPRHELRDALAGLSKVVPPKTTLPVFQLVRLSAYPGRLTLTATDLDSVLAYRCGSAHIQTAGETLVPFTELSRLAHGRGAEAVELGSVDHRLQLTQTFAGQRLSREVTATPLDEWPLLPPKPEVGAVDPALLGHLRKAAPFASRDTSRPSLGGLYLDSSAEGDYVVATDGRRLSAFNTVRQPFRTSCIVPASQFLLWTELTPTELQVGYSADQAGGWFRLVTLRWDYQVRTIGGTFPHWRQVIPPSAGAWVLTISEADAGLLTEALPLFTGQELEPAGVTLHRQAGAVVVRRAGDPAPPSTSLRLPSSTLEPHTAHLSVDRTYLLAALAAGFRAFRWADGQGPLYSRDRQGGLHVLMPLRSPASQPTPGQPRRPQPGR